MVSILTKSGVDALLMFELIMKKRMKDKRPAELCGPLLLAAT
jgi:hypothetical protein